MIIDCISDLHGCQPNLPGGDLLIVAGDLTAYDSFLQHMTFREWLDGLDYRKIILIAGNHDGFFVKNKPAKKSLSQVSYLEDSGDVFEGLKIWGSPWTPTFHNWHFMKERGYDIREKWDLIPDDVDILVTHGPPWGFLDIPDDKQERHCGCMDLLDAVARVKPKLHVFGHIHGGYGIEEASGTKFINASIMNEDYKPVNKPVRTYL